MIDDKPKDTVELDWVAYYRKFCEIHGEPVIYKGRQLFSDGYRYSIKGHAGPEWRPPEDPDKRRKLRLEYWRIYAGLAKDQIGPMRDQIKALEDMQRSRGAPLQQVVVVQKQVDGATRLVKESQNVDIGGLRHRLLWLEAEYEESHQWIQALEAGFDERDEWLGSTIDLPGRDVGPDRGEQDSGVSEAPGESVFEDIVPEGTGGDG